MSLNCCSPMRPCTSMASIASATWHRSSWGGGGGGGTGAQGVVVWDTAGQGRAREGEADGAEVGGAAAAHICPPPRPAPTALPSSSSPSSAMPCRNSAIDRLLKREDKGERAGGDEQRKARQAMPCQGSPVDTRQAEGPQAPTCVCPACTTPDGRQDRSRGGTRGAQRCTHTHAPSRPLTARRHRRPAAQTGRAPGRPALLAKAPPPPPRPPPTWRFAAPPRAPALKTLPPGRPSEQEE